MDFEILELKRKLGLNKENYRIGLSKLFKYFNIKNEEYLDDYDKMSERMIELGTDLRRIKTEMNSLDNDFEKLKKSILLRENIDLSKEIFKFKEDSRGKLLDEMYREGFIDAETWEVIKKLIWDNKYRKVYTD